MKHTDQDDAEANYFAMHLLVPEALLAREGQKLTQFDLAEGTPVSKLAKIFGVSEAVMAYRLAEDGHLKP